MTKALHGLKRAKAWKLWGAYGRPETLLRFPPRKRNQRLRPNYAW
jgi:hypothetical protein